WGQTTIISCPLPICLPGQAIFEAAARFPYPCGEVNYQEQNYHSVPVVNRPVIQMSRNSSRQRLLRILMYVSVQTALDHGTSVLSASGLTLSFGQAVTTQNTRVTNGWLRQNDARLTCR
ncbi:MAG: hypothetical protein P8X93_07450, partial [Gammaproteobacteria bacterium]